MRFENSSNNDLKFGLFLSQSHKKYSAWVVSTSCMLLFVLSHFHKERYMNKGFK